MADRQTLARFLAAPERATSDQLYGVALDALDHQLEAEIVAALTARLRGAAARDYRLWQVLGLAERQRLHAAEAEVAFARAQALAPGNALIAHSLARVRLERGRPDPAAFDRALALAPGDLSVLHGRMLAVLAAGEGARGLAELTALLAGRNQWFEGHLAYAKLAAIEAKIGRIGTVVETSGVSATYTYCSLKSVARDKTGPLPPNSIGWSHHITLTFRQLRP